MDEVRDRSVGCSGSEGRLPNPLPEQQVASLNSDSQGVSILPGESREVFNPQEGSRGHVGKEGLRVSGCTGTSVLQQAFSGSQSLRKMAPGVRRFATKQVCGNLQVLDGDSANGAGTSKGRRLDDFPGHEGCLFPYPHTPSVQEIPQVCVRWSGVPVQGPVLRPEYSTSSFYLGAGSVQQNRTPCRIQDSSVPGRLASAGQVARGDVESQKVCSGISTRVRHIDKSRKVSFGPVTICGLSGDANRLDTFLGFSGQETSRQSVRTLQKILVLRYNVGKILAKLAGLHGIIGEVCSWCQVMHEKVPILSQKGLEEKLSATEYPDSYPQGFKRKSCLVARPRETGEGSVASPEGTGPSTLHRCIQRQLGCDSRSDTSVRKVVQEGVQGAHKQTRTEGDFVCPKRLERDGDREDSSCLCRQHNCSILCKETRRHKVVGPVSSGRGVVPVVRRTQSDSDPQVHTGEDQCGGRHPEQEGTDNPHRMDPECAGLRATLEGMGKTTSGSFCHVSDEQASYIFFASPRPQCSGSGRVAAVLGESRRVCVSSFRYYQTSHQQTQTVEELQNDFSSAMVATEGVVPRPSRTSSGRSKDTASEKRLAKSTSKQGSSSRSPHASSNRMETILRLGRAKALSENVIKRVFRARAQSTNALYQLRWSQYVAWCRKNKLSAIRPSVNSICKFFIYLWEEKKLAIGTIKGFRSVLQSVLRHVDFNVSNNHDISDVIRSFIVERPLVKKESVAWNLDIVLKFLCSGRFEPLSSASLRDITRKTLFLVAMALDKRVSELQALSGDVGFSEQGAMVSLSLGFRAKNDNKVKALPRSFLVKSLQQLVGQEEERKLCPVRALKAYLSRTKAYSRKGRNLFLAPRNPERSASKNGLAFLIKSVIKEAHEHVSPESEKLFKVKSQEIRAISTSLSFAHNLSIESVIEAAQWRSHSVFASHYLKDVALTYNECCALGPLVAAGTIIS